MLVVVSVPCVVLSFLRCVMLCIGLFDLVLVFVGLIWFVLFR